MASNTYTIKTSSPTIYCDWSTSYAYTSNGVHYYTVALTIRKPSGTYGYYIEANLNGSTQRFKDNSPSSWSSYGPLYWYNVPSGSGITWYKGGSGGFNNFTPSYDTPLWNDINAYKPDGTSQNGLKFDLTTSDGGSWSNITNEPTDWYHLSGTTATIKNIRSNVTGIHYIKNGITGTNASSFTWTINTSGYVVSLYSVWNTYEIVYDNNGGSGVMQNTDCTYNTSASLLKNSFTKSGYQFLGWAKDSTAEEPEFEDESEVLNLTETDNATVVLYAIWKKVPAGKMQIKTSSGWLEGTAYRKTENGWIKAKNVYVKTENGWRKSRSK